MEIPKGFKKITYEKEGVFQDLKERNKYRIQLVFSEDEMPYYVFVEQYVKNLTSYVPMESTIYPATSLINKTTVSDLPMKFPYKEYTKQSIIHGLIMPHYKEVDSVQSLPLYIECGDLIGFYDLIETPELGEILKKFLQTEETNGERLH